MVYANAFRTNFLVECRDVRGADFSAALDGRPDIEPLYAYLIGAVPMVLESWRGLRIRAGLAVVADLSSITAPL